MLFFVRQEHCQALLEMYEHVPQGVRSDQEECKKASYVLQGSRDHPRKRRWKDPRRRWRHCVAHNVQGCGEYDDNLMDRPTVKDI